MIVIAAAILASACQGEVAQETGVDPQSLYVGRQLDTAALLNTIALGSCNQQDEPQDMWPVIGGHDPDLWIWLGDNIYGDTEDMDVLARKYKKQKFGADYAAFRENTQVIGIWDDHDYGLNDGDKRYAKKAESEELLLNFLDVPQDAAVRGRPGAYQSYTFGPKDKQVKILLLDARYFRDTLSKSKEENRRYLPNKTGDILGEAQWQWLERQLTDSPAQVHLIGSGVQILPQDHGYEKWANFPKSRQRLFDLLQRSQPANPVLLSGDRHIAELSRIELDSLPQPIYELTASGMTHSWETVGEEPNRHRVGELVPKKNFGLIRIDWSGDQPDLRVEVRGVEENALLLEKALE